MSRRRSGRAQRKARRRQQRVEARKARTALARELEAPGLRQRLVEVSQEMTRVIKEQIDYEGWKRKIFHV